MNDAADGVAPVGPAAGAVARYLRAFERRDLDAALAGWHGPVAIVAVGGATAGSLDAIVARSATRYRRVAKRFERWLEWPSEAGGFHVLSTGALHGELADGTPFDGVRYADLFELDSQCGILRQEIWNDFGAAPPSP